ncbi:MAG TPA: sugar phosphate isomerase/epimerase [Clostridiaceae bacterium]|jgi:D-psicose/D-tagatose/L-ribulose 3-epimerase|nr:sugar phosphate isomerase/epimerase [Clostridiaceae bacterium]
MKLGIHAYAWCSEWSNDTLYIIDKAKEANLDYLEIPLMRLDLFDPVAVKERLDGLEAVTSNVLLADDVDITSFDPAARKNGVQYLKDCVKATADIGGKMFSGVIYSQYLKDAKSAPTEEEWEFSAKALKEVAQYAKNLGVELALEPVTRYESYLLNTSEQTVKLIDMIDEDNVFVHLDSYHMNVEEKNFYDPVITAGNKLKCFHICENDRGIPGSGHINFDDIFRGFKEIGFNGYLGFEGFSDVTDNMSTWVWRQLVPDRDTFINESIKFARKMIEKYEMN